MGFKFSLASVLRLRESIEHREELALQRIQFELARLQRRLDELKDEIAVRGRERDECLRTAIPAYRIRDLDGGIESAKAMWQTLAEQRLKLIVERDRRMHVYQAARKGRQMISDLRAEKRTEWEQDQNRIQQKQLDDIFAARMKQS